jgi:hypothetical protein
LQARWKEGVFGSSRHLVVAAPGDGKKVWVPTLITLVGGTSSTDAKGSAYHDAAMLNFRELPADGVAFEQLIRELLLRSEFEVHWTGVGPDGGRDLVVTERAKGQLAPFQRKWLVSCKHHAHSGASVGLHDIQDIMDSCAAVDAGGFLLACSTQPSSSVVRRLDEIQSNGQLLARYWDSIEIERRLDTPATFPLISLFFPISGTARPWRIYNTDSPSSWAANYYNYFMYLTSRTANTYPPLKYIEMIIGLLESVELPRGVQLPTGEEWGHYIRPRAIFFDSNNVNFVVFADYLFPRGRENDVLVPRDINLGVANRVDLDDQGWYIPTHWDIRYVDIYEGSPNFHLDHRDYYLPFMNEYRTGISRGYLLDDLSELPVEDWRATLVLANRRRFERR